MVRARGDETMHRIPKPHVLTAALLGLALAIGAAQPAAAQEGHERRAERLERRLQKARGNADATPPAAPESRGEPPRRMERFERLAPPSAAPRESEAGRREDWGEMARRQRERQAAQEPRGPWQQRERALPQPETPPLPAPDIAERQAPTRAPAEYRRLEQRQRIAEQRDRRRESEDRQRELAEAGSPQAKVIAEAREREARRDWRDDREAWRDGRDDRVSRQQQRDRIEEQRRQHAQWLRDDGRRRHEHDRHRDQLERQRRNAQYRYQQDYWRRWLAAQARWNHHRFDYDRDPFFHTPFNYRYSYGGRWHSTNSYGAEILRQAVRDGYREGWYAGQADRMDRWQFDYRNNYGWIDGSYGYSGRYVSHNDYRWYFRQGFERGYRDGYYGRYQYGRYDRDGAMILPAILGMILGFAID